MSFSEKTYSRHLRFVATTILMLLMQACGGGSGDAQSVPGVGPSANQFESEIAAFESEDAVNPPEAGQIVFVGSSSIRIWDTLEQDMAPLPVIQRGFGGSTMTDLNFFRDRIVTNYNPAMVVVYSGENDIAIGRTPDQVIAEYEEFFDQVERAVEGVQICVISIKPAPARAAQWPNMADTNTLIQDAVSRNPSRCFFEATSPMLSSSGAILPGLHISDDIHLNDAGYTIWTDIIQPELARRFPAP